MFFKGANFMRNLARIIYCSALISAFAIGALGFQKEAERLKFEQVSGWKVLRWDMSLPDARKALEGARMPYEEKLLVKDGKRLLKLVENGWEITVYFDEKGRMVQILLQSSYLKSRSEVDAIVESMQTRYGKAHDMNSISYKDENRSDTNYIWKNGTTELTLDVAHYLQRDEWVVWEIYTPAQQSPDSIEWPKDWSLYLGKQVTIEGTALNAKLGAILVGDGQDIWIDGLDAWPEGYYFGRDQGKRVRVTGTVIERDDLPVLSPEEAGPPKAGVPVTQGMEPKQASKRFLLKNAKWTLKE
jgi:hypothetical protein